MPLATSAQRPLASSAGVVGAARPNRSRPRRGYSGRSRAITLVAHSDDHGFLPDAVIVVVYAAGVILWAAGFAVTLAISGVLGVLSGRWRSLVAPLLFGLTIGVISAATVAGDLGRGGEFVICAVWGLILAAAMAAGILLRRRSG